MEQSVVILLVSLAIHYHRADQFTAGAAFVAEGPLFTSI
jgi:hypothetical protein